MCIRDSTCTGRDTGKRRRLQYLDDPVSDRDRHCDRCGDYGTVGTAKEPSELTAAETFIKEQRPVEHDLSGALFFLI